MPRVNSAPNDWGEICYLFKHSMADQLFISSKNRYYQIEEIRGGQTEKVKVHENSINSWIDGDSPTDKSISKFAKLCGLEKIDVEGGLKDFLTAIKKRYTAAGVDIKFEEDTFHKILKAGKDKIGVNKSAEKNKLAKNLIGKWTGWSFFLPIDGDDRGNDKDVNIFKINAIFKVASDNKIKFYEILAGYKVSGSKCINYQESRYSADVEIVDNQHIRMKIGKVDQAIYGDALFYVDARLDKMQGYIILNHPKAYSKTHIITIKIFLNKEKEAFEETSSLAPENDLLELKNMRTFGVLQTINQFNIKEEKKRN